MHADRRNQCGCGRIALLGAIALAATVPSVPTRAAGRVVTLRAEDGLNLTATWYEPPARPGAAVVLVHMLHRSRRDWDAMASRLASEGIGALAIDLRGHGESQSWGPGEPPDYSALVLDVRAARRFLTSRPEVLPGRIGVAGASIGANLAMLEAAGDSAVASLVLLSPSLDYRGLRIDAAARKFTRPMLLVASDDDPYAARTARELQKAGGGPRELILSSHSGHGTGMLARDADLGRALVDWFRRTLI